MMIPIQCGAANHSILALYDPPASNPARGSILLCNPWMAEYFPAYAIMRFLARRLSQAGFHVMRFDYYGCGDSGGDFTEGNPDCWTEDAAMVLEELQALSGNRTVTPLGVRSGAMIASRLAAARRDVDRICFWDPIIDPVAYLSTIAKQNGEAGAKIPKGWPLKHGTASIELDGYSFTEALVSSTLNSPVDIAAWRWVRSVLAVTSLASPDDLAPLLAQAAERTLPLKSLNCPWPTGPDGQPVFTPGVMPVKAVDAIIAGLK